MTQCSMMSLMTVCLLNKMGILILRDFDIHFDHINHIT